MPLDELNLTLQTKAHMRSVFQGSSEKNYPFPHYYCYVKYHGHFFLDNSMFSLKNREAYYYR